LYCEYTAHSKNIIGLSIHPSSNILVSASEDTYVAVWQLPYGSAGGGAEKDKENNKAAHTSLKNICMHSCTTGLITGMYFLNMLYCSLDNILFYIQHSTALYCVHINECSNKHSD
jgi:WD40 repeat protein